MPMIITRIKRSCPHAQYTTQDIISTVCSRIAVSRTMRHVLRFPSSTSFFFSFSNRVRLTVVLPPLPLSIISFFFIPFFCFLIYEKYYSAMVAHGLLVFFLMVSIGARALGVPLKIVGTWRYFGLNQRQPERRATFIASWLIVLGNLNARITRPENVHLYAQRATSRNPLRSSIALPLFLSLSITLPFYAMRNTSV